MQSVEVGDFHPQALGCYNQVNISKEIKKSEKGK